MRKITKRSAAIIGATAVAIGGGAAWAASAWVTGGGTANATSAKVQDIVAVAVVTDKLYPGKLANAAVTVTNPNDYPVKLSSAAITKLDFGLSSGALSPANGCNQEKADLSLGGVPADISIPAKSATAFDAGTWTNFIKMGTNADVACAGNTFKVTFSLQGSIA